jgi:hypothetical protein
VTDCTTAVGEVPTAQCVLTAVLTAVCAYRLLYLQRSVHIDRIALCTGCPTSYQTRHFFNNFTTNENIATKFEADIPHCVRNVKEKNVLQFKFRCNIFTGVGIIKQMPGSVASGTPCTKPYKQKYCRKRIDNLQNAGGLLV